MTIDPTTTIGGCRLVRIRDFLRRYLHQEFSAKDLVSILKISHPQAVTILKWLHRNQYVESFASHRTRYSWRATEKTGSLANASARRRITRATADRLLSALLDRAREVNHSGPFAYHVSRIFVWGSYLGENPTLGDLDVVVELSAIESEPRLQQKREQKRLLVACASGRAPAGIVKRIYWPKEEVMLFLKARSPSLHFTFPEDGIFVRSPRRLVFGARPRD